MAGTIVLTVTGGAVEQPLGQVQGLAVERLSSTSARLTWTSLPGANGYEVERSPTAAAGSWSQLTVTSSTLYTDTAVNPDLTYYYRVRGTNGSQTGEYATSVTLIPEVFGWTFSQTAGERYDLGNALVGQTVTVDALWQTVPGADPQFTLSQGTGVTVNAATGAVTATTAGVQDFEIDLVDAADTLSQLSDWVSRASGPGVVWANDFENASSPSLYWSYHINNFTEHKRTGYLNTNATKTAPDGILRSHGGVVPGRGCLEQYTPAGVVIGSNRWGRPLAPTTGAIAVAPYNVGTSQNPIMTEAYNPSSMAPEALDINNAGWPRLDFRPSSHGVMPGDAWNKIANTGGGLICHPNDINNWQRAVPAGAKAVAANEIYAAPPDGFYMQYFVKFPTLPDGSNLLDFTTGTTNPQWGGAWMGKSWLMHALNTSDINPEIGSLLWGNVGFPAVHYGRRADYYYGNVQSGVNTTHIQNALNATCTYGNPASCWKYPKDKWVSVLVHVIPGQQNVSDNGDLNAWLRGDFGALIKNQSLEIWVADEDRINAGLGYLKLVDAQNYAIYYTGFYNSDANSGPFAGRYYNVSSSGGFLQFTAYANSGKTVLDGSMLVTGSAVNFPRSQSGQTVSVLPTGINHNSVYFVIGDGSGTFRIAASKANALAGQAIPYTDSGSLLGSERVMFSIAPGYSVVQFIQQMNPTGSNGAYEKPSWVIYDQFILSTEPIPCPEIV